MGKKELLANLLYRSRLLRVAASLSENNIVVLTYHRIRADPPAVSEGLEFDEEVFGPTQSEFSRQVKWLRENFDVLSENDLISVLGEPGPYKRRYAAITFDDGYLDNYTLAYPVLRAQSAPAIFFVCPGLLDFRQVGWWDAISYLIKKSQRAAVTIRGQHFSLGANKPAVQSELMTWMKLRPASETEGLVAELAAACGVDQASPALQDRQFMTWEQVIEVSKNGIDIGSHTCTHRVLATLDEESQRRELSESKRALEARLERPIRTLAYPVGGYEHFTPETMRLAQEAGYEYAFSFQTGANLPGPQPYNIRRITCAERFDPLFACSTVFPRTFSWLRPLPESHRTAAGATLLA